MSKGSDKGMKGLLGRVEKRFGKGAVMHMDDARDSGMRVFSTGSLALDVALGAGGLPYGRVVEVYGPESSGKTTLALHAVVEVQKAGGRAAFIDAEHALDMRYAEDLGVDSSRLLVSQPDCGEQALEIAEMVARSDEIDLVVVDSVAALTPRAEIEGEMGDQHVGLQARMMGQALRKLNAAANRNQTAVLFINQLRQKIGVTFGSSETTTGGNALKFYASVRLDIRRIGAVKDGDGNAIGNRTKVKIAKNKLAPPFRICEFEIIYGRGICRAGEVLDMGIEAGFVTKSGSWYALGDERLGQGRERARAALRAEPERLDALVAQLREGLIGEEAAGSAGSEDQASLSDAA
ncbi:MAG: recombinase RecA [Myxococcota bacterium]